MYFHLIFFNLELHFSIALLLIMILLDICITDSSNNSGFLMSINWSSFSLSFYFFPYILKSYQSNTS